MGRRERRGVGVGVGRGQGEVQMTSYIHNYLNTSDVAADDPVQPFAEV